MFHQQTACMLAPGPLHSSPCLSPGIDRLETPLCQSQRTLNSHHSPRLSILDPSRNTILSSQRKRSFIQSKPVELESGEGVPEVCGDLRWERGELQDTGRGRRIVWSGR